MLARSAGSSLGPVANQPSRISSSTGSEVERRLIASTLASFHVRAPRAVSASAHSAARTPATLFAAIDAPVPVQQQTMPCSASPSATSRAARSHAQAQSSRSPSASAPWTIGSCPRRRSSSSSARATGVSMSLATETFTSRQDIRRRAWPQNAQAVPLDDRAWSARSRFPRRGPAIGDLLDHGRLGLARETPHLAEGLLESSRGDHLEDARRRIARVSRTCATGRAA